MKKIRFRRVTAAILAILIVTSTTVLPSAFEGVVLIRPAITAHAAGTATLSEDGKTLTLSGEVSKDEVQRLCTNNGNTTVTTIIASEGTVLPEDCSSMFSYFTAVTSIDLSNADTSNVTDMKFMFYNCTNLTTLNLSGFDTSSVANMSRMFGWCEKLTALDLSGFKTGNVKQMYNMFAGCQSLKALDLSGFDTSSVTDMSSMFYCCEALTSLDLSSFNTQSVNQMQFMFQNCTALTDIVVGEGWTTTSLKEDEGHRKDMFLDCTSLPNFNAEETDAIKAYFGNGGYLSPTYTLSEDGTTLTLRGHVSKEQVRGLCTNNGNTTVTTIIASEGTVLPEDCSSMFHTFSKVTSIDLSNADTSNVMDMQDMFYGCAALTALNLSGFDTSSVTNMSSMFGWCENLTALDLSGFDTSSVTNMYGMFYRCVALTTLDLSSFDTSMVTDMSTMFHQCTNLKDIIIGDAWKLNDALISGGMFNGCTTLPGYDENNVTAAYAKIGNGGYLSPTYTLSKAGTTLTLRGHVSKAQVRGLCPNYINNTVTTIIASEGTVLPEDCSYLFSNFVSVQKIDLSNADTKKVTDMRRMFVDCKSLSTLNISHFDTSRVTKMDYMFDQCEKLEELDLKGFDTSKVESMAGMFDGCQALTTLDLSSFDTSSVTMMSTMFASCSALTELTFGDGFDTSKVTNMRIMFEDCKNLKSLDLSSFDTSNVKKMMQMFAGCENLKSLDLSSFDTSNVDDATKSNMFDG